MSLKLLFSKRWYDQDPTVSLAMSLLRNTSFDNQLQIADILIENGINLSIKFKSGHRLFNRRWYDHDDKMTDAIEYFRLFPEEEQKKMAVQIIEYLYNLDGSANRCNLSCFNNKTLDEEKLS
ncbi:MAG: hypothetical protein PHC34_10355 [Candidatus Gastranaerophilales bacterium]|nr:hypothetical protein [Candidatus Gastranaerophilales bacterium]